MKSVVRNKPGESQRTKVMQKCSTIEKGNTAYLCFVPHYFELITFETDHLHARPVCTRGDIDQ